MVERVAVDVEWDGEASVWVAVAADIGLFTEAETLDELRRKIPVMASDLLSDDPGQSVELHVELTVKFDETVTAAA